MAFVYALDPLTPAGGEAASLGDDRIREFKNAMIERVNSRFVSVDADPWIIKSPASGGNTQTLTPITDNLYVLGTAVLRFADIRSVLATITTVTGTLVGSATTVSAAAQPAITSVGILTSLAIAALGKLFLDGGVNTSIRESAADTITFETNAADRISINTTQLLLGSTIDVIVQATKRVYLDGGGDTYFHEQGANRIDFIVGGNTRFGVQATSVFVNATDFLIDPLKKLYLDAGANTYIVESAADTITFVAGAVSTFIIGNSYVALSTFHLYLDNGTNTYIKEFSADVIAFVAGGTDTVRIGNGYFAVSSGGIKIFLDGGGDTSIRQSAADVITLETGGADRMSLSTTQLILGTTIDLLVQATKQLFLDGGGNTYFVEVSPDEIDIVAGGTVMLTLANGALSFFGAAVATGPRSVSGSRGGNAALLSLLTAFANYNLIIDNTS